MAYEVIAYGLDLGRKCFNCCALMLNIKLIFVRETRIVNDKIAQYQFVNEKYFQRIITPSLTLFNCSMNGKGILVRTTYDDVRNQISDKYNKPLVLYTRRRYGTIR